MNWSIRCRGCGFMSVYNGSYQEVKFMFWCKKLILTSVHLLDLLCELFKNAQTWITLRYIFYCYISIHSVNTVIPWLTSDHANEDFFAVFWIRLTNVLVDERANIKQQTWTVGPFQELIFSVCVWQRNFQFNSIKCIIYFQYNSVKIASFSFYFPFSFIQLGCCSSQPLVSFCLFIVCFLLFYKTYL